MFTHQPQIQLEPARCFDCGRYWAYEKAFSLNSPSCPFCAQAKIDKANRMVLQIERSNASIRGALTRLKK